MKPSLLVFALLIPTLAALGQGEAQTTWWSQDLEIGPGLFEGSGNRITVLKEVLPEKGADEPMGLRVTVLPETGLRNTELFLNRSALEVKKSAIREVDLLATFESRLVATDCYFENSIFLKVGRSARRYSTSWSLANCLVYGPMFTKMDARDYGWELTGSTFYHVDFPPAIDRKPPPAGKEDQGRTLVDCRFVRCKIPVSLLALSENCVFEDCTFFGPDEVFKPVGDKKVVANLIGSAEGFPESVGSISFEGRKGDLEGVGSSLDHDYERGKVTVRGFPDWDAAEVSPIGVNKRPLPSNKPKKK